MLSTANEKIEKSGMDCYIRSLYKSPEFPATRQYFESNKKLQVPLEKNFPQGSIHHATDPVVRGMKHKMTGGPTTLASFFRTGTSDQLTKGKAWNYQSMVKAAKEFEVPASSRIYLFFPEIFDREILLKYPEYQFKYEKNGMEFTGLKTLCPWCKSNKHIVFSDKSDDMAGRQRTIADYRSMVPIYCHRNRCENKECSGEKKNWRRCRQGFIP
jgi:hypothetical protein